MSSVGNYTQYYLKWHKDTDAHRNGLRTFYHRLIGPYLPKDPSASILDVGCGMGFALHYLRLQGYVNIAGIDTDSGQVKLASQNSLPVTLVTDSVAFLKKSPTKIDFLLCLDVLEHLPKSLHLDFLSSIYQALKPKGRLILSVPNANSSIAARWRYNDWTHETSFTEHSLDFVLSNAGFQRITIQPAEFVLRPRLSFLPISGSRHWWAFCFFRLFRRLEMMAELGPEQGRKIPLSLNLMAIADKS